MLIGLLAKVLDPVGMLWAMMHWHVPSRLLVLIPIHDLLWWIPFALIIRDAVWQKAN